VPVLIIFAMVLVGTELTTAEFRRIARQPGTIVVASAGQFVLRPVMRWHFVGFLIFSDYSRTPLQLAAIQEIAVVYGFTHDPIPVGGDAPTHKPIEHLASLLGTCARKGVADG